jgi:hypothetical protein
VPGPGVSWAGRTKRARGHRGARQVGATRATDHHDSPTGTGTGASALSTANPNDGNPLSSCPGRRRTAPGYGPRSHDRGSRYRRRTEPNAGARVAQHQTKVVRPRSPADACNSVAAHRTLAPRSCPALRRINPPWGQPPILVPWPPTSLCDAWVISSESPQRQSRRRTRRRRKPPCSCYPWHPGPGR